MHITDLRDWMRAVRAIGQLVEVNGADGRQDIGAITRLFMAQPGRPALLFREIPGCPSDVSILTNVATSPERVALSLRMPADITSRALVEHWRTFARTQRRIPPRVVTDGPVLEHVMTGADVDLSRFPAPQWHEQDGSVYLGTGSAVVIKDPDSDWVNVGCYRVAVHDHRTAGIMISASHHGRTLMEKWWKRGEAAPIAVSVGQDPLLYLVAGVNAPEGVSEYDVAGGVAGEPIDVIRAPRTGLPIPARAEIVLEGVVPPDERHDEGPFGEWTGYYAAGRRPQPVIRVEAVYHRTAPVVVGAIPGLPPSDNTYYLGFLVAASVWNDIEQAGVPGVRGVWSHEGGAGRMWITVAIAQQYAGHARQAGLIASQCLGGVYANRWVIVVDDDIDPADTNAVLWAMSTRVDPREDLIVVPGALSTALDPMAYPEEQPMYNARVVVDACRPWHRRHTFPAATTTSDETRRRIRERYPDLMAMIERGGLDASMPAKTR